MGWISKRKMMTGHGLNQNPQNNGSDGGPLRKVLGTVPDKKYRSVMLELLECGHTQLPKSDIIGHRPASRRRCRKCKLGRPADAQPTEM